jgi:hypothetical protein
MSWRGCQRMISLQGRPPSAKGCKRASTVRRVLTRVLAVIPLVVMTSACGGGDLSETGRQSKGPHFALIEDDETARPRRGFVRVDELAPAPLVAVRVLRPDELTSRLIRRAEDMLINHEGPFGSEVVVEMDNHTYIARFEWHYQYDGNADRAPEWHKGLTLYATE